MILSNEIAEAGAIERGLRDAASVCTPSQGALRARLVVAAEKVQQLVQLVTHAVERIEQLELELRQLKAAGQGGAQ